MNTVEVSEHRGKGLQVLPHQGQAGRRGQLIVELLDLDWAHPAIVQMRLGHLHWGFTRRVSFFRGVITDPGELATHDELTGLSNRAHMGEMLQQYLQRHEEEGKSFSVGLLDLDFFKRVNDTHGHGVGDEVLKAFAEAMKKNLRESDLMARWGGEEFLLIFSQSLAESSLAVIERLRSSFAEQVVSSSVPSLRASFSAGLVSPAKGETQSKVLERADQALYAAKSAGRNRCCVG